MKVCIKKLKPNAVLPKYQTNNSAGMDLHAYVDETFILRPQERAIIWTGIAIAVPHGYEAQVRPRSGLAIKNGISVVNSPGTIDSDYRGEVGVILINHGTEEFVINCGDRIAQLVIAKHEHAQWQEVDDLDITTRGDGGLGSTGK